MKKSLKLFSIIVCSLLMMIPCFVYAEENTPSPTESPSPSPSPSEPPINNYKIELNYTELNLSVGESKTLVATVTPSSDDVKIKWSSSDPEAVTVDDNGKVTAGSKAAQGVEITATIDGTDITAKCTVNVTRSLGTDATLKSLTIKNGTLDKKFQPNVYEYSVSIASNVSSLDIEYELSDNNASYFGPSSDDNKNLKNGDQLKLNVVAEDGETSQTYTLTIVKDATSLKLKSLKINGYALNESFDADILEYTASIPYEIDTITVAAVAEDNAASVKVTGLTNLRVGENAVTITVSDKAGNTRTYRIIVTREKEASVEENPTSIITSTDHGSTSDHAPIVGDDNDDSDFLKYVIVSFACLILFAIGGIGIYFYLKTSPKKLRKELSNLKAQKETSPMIEVTDTEEKSSVKSSSSVKKENLEETKEFRIEELDEKPEKENLFDDE